MVSLPKIRVGLPKGLITYKFLTLWKTFFEELDAEVIISPPTNKSIREVAISAAPDEDCYSTKIYFGHVLYLKDKVEIIGEVSKVEGRDIFINGIIKDSNGDTCTKGQFIYKEVKKEKIETLADIKF